MLQVTGAKGFTATVGVGGAAAAGGAGVSATFEGRKVYVAGVAQPAAFRFPCGPLCQALNRGANKARQCVREGFARLFYYSERPSYRRCLALAFFRARIELKAAPTKADYQAALTSKLNLLETAESETAPRRRNLAAQDEDADDDENYDADADDAGVVADRTTASADEPDLLMAADAEDEGEDDRVHFHASASFNFGIPSPRATKFVVAGNKGFYARGRVCWPCIFNRMRATQARQANAMVRRAEAHRNAVLAAQATALSRLYSMRKRGIWSRGIRLAMEVARCRLFARKPLKKKKKGLQQEARARIMAQFKSDVVNMANSRFRSFRKYFENHLLRGQADYAGDTSIYGFQDNVVDDTRDEHPITDVGLKTYGSDASLRSPPLLRGDGIGGARVEPGVNNEDDYNPEAANFVTPIRYRRKGRVGLAVSPPINIKRGRKKGAPEGPVRDPDLRNTPDDDDLYQ